MIEMKINMRNCSLFRLEIRTVRTSPTRNFTTRACGCAQQRRASSSALTSHSATSRGSISSGTTGLRPEAVPLSIKNNEKSRPFLLTVDLVS